MDSSKIMKRNTYYPGDVIVDYCDPFFKVLNLEHNQTRCNYCMEKRNQLIMCLSCGRVRYCDLLCQEKDYLRGHFLECKSECFRRYSQNCMTNVQATLYRLYAFLKANTHFRTKQYTMHDGAVLNFDNLMSNENIWALTPQNIEEFQDFTQHLQKENANVTLDYLIRLYGIVKKHAKMLWKDNEFVGFVIYMENTTFGHSCKPTAFCVMKHGKIQIRALAFIPPDVPPLLNYMEPIEYYSMYERQQILRESFNFKCQCERCVLELNNPVDYQMLIAMHSTLATCMMKYPFIEHSLYDIYKMHLNILSMLRELFHEYDPRITDHMIFFSNFARHLYSHFGKMILGNLCFETNLHMFITFGQNSELYKELVATK